VSKRPVSSRSRTWLGIGVFVATPWLLGAVHVVIKPPELLSEPAQKAFLASKANVPFDTVAVGDSRILRIGAASFSKRGWTFFNMGMSGLSPEDTALQLLFALDRFPVKRVVMGVSFENMTARYPFEFSRYAEDPVFRNLRFSAFLRSQPAIRTPARAIWRDTLDELYPIGRAAVTLRYYRSRWKRWGTPNNTPDIFSPADGTAAYAEIQKSIQAGRYDFAEHTNPADFFDRPDGDARYLEVKKLSEDAQDMYRRMFQALRARRIPCVVFETVKTPAYQKMIDDSALLAGLQAQWREFYRSESRGSVRFLDASAVRDCYHEPDFFDATHFLGATTERQLAERLAETLATLEGAVVADVGAQAIPGEGAQ